MKVPVYRQYGSNGQQGAAKGDKVLQVDGGVDFGFQFGVCPDAVHFHFVVAGV
ncbi:hypothetical protein [Endozoicomonas sp. 2B-B]